MARLLTGFSRFSTQRNDVLRTLTGPYLVLGARINPTLPVGSTNGTNLLFDPAKEEIITVPDLIVPKELMGSSLVGRWGIFVH
ncbi:unnamed protein product [Arabis nemorensis]|uniref:Uncharacterized protein n=1 Tax=Arabis nemorensis TaxID=586526 RepID=A0A565CK79_9BRAS|nr:unnamed protein product [Arabis nemorensis]